VIASLSVSGPTFRLGEQRVKELVVVVQDAADEVSRRLGFGTA
jgi:DNA-binding IclR family transcriptional regulator